MNEMAQITINFLKKMAEIEKKVGLVYLKCAEIWPEEKETFSSIAKEEFGHEAIALQAADVIGKNPEKLHAADMLNEAGVAKTLLDLDALLKKLDERVISKKNMVTALYFLEHSIVEDKYLSGIYINDAVLEKKLNQLIQETGHHKILMSKLLQNL